MKSFHLYQIKASEDKTERNLNQGKFGLKTSFKKEKKRCFPPVFTEYTCLRSPCSDREAHFRYMITQI